MRAFDAILEEARQWRADLIVMGCHGWRHRYTLGAVAARVLTTAPCPVLTVSRRTDAALSTSFPTASSSCDGIGRSSAA